MSSPACSANPGGTIAGIPVTADLAGRIANYRHNQFPGSLPIFCVGENCYDFTIAVQKMHHL